jgi:hypothetical protein
VIGLLELSLIACFGLFKEEPMTRDELRDRARLVLEPRCGSCHISSYESAKPGALAIFDLAAIEWSEKMSELQLKDALYRLDGPLPPDGHDSDVTPEEKALFLRFIEAELSARSRLGSAARSSASEAPRSTAP